MPGANLIVPQAESGKKLNGQVSGSVLEAAVLAGQNPWTLAAVNSLAGSWDVLPGERLFFMQPEGTTRSFGPIIQSMTVAPLPLVQGKTTLIKIKAKPNLTWSGSLAGKPLAFQKIAEDEYVALQGVHAMAKVGLQPFSLQAQSGPDTVVNIEQMVLLSAAQLSPRPAHFRGPGDAQT